MKKSMSILVMLLSTGLLAQKQKSYNLNKIFKSNKVEVVNRVIKAIDSSGFDYIKVSEGKGEGIVWLPIKDFKNGKIKIEMRGKDVMQRSFIGIAFHGQSNETYDAVYCRPFNFFAKDSVRRIHAIQYISHPNNTWKKLRDERNAIFEKEISNPPNPNGWFTLTIVVDNKSVKAYINEAKKPSLEVEKLNNSQSGKIGIFVADSGGDFRNITVVNTEQEQLKIEIGTELEVYPTGFMPTITSNIFIKQDWALRLRLGANLADRKDYSGLNDNETAKGFGGSIGIVKYFPIWKGNIIAGFTTDLWRMKTEWIDNNQKGTTTNLVIQPWINSGYLYNVTNKMNAGISIGFGKEINTMNKGEEVGQGWMGIATFSVNYSLN